LLSLGLLYLVGDVKGGIYRQTSISVGDGIHTAMRIYQKLRR
jgi:thioredoxin reductase